MNNNNPLVSICCITYNQEKYIQDALEGFIVQKTSFPIEIIVHDDCSTDKTPNIIKEYVEKHPGLIRAIFQEQNQYSLGKKIFPIVFSKSMGKYIAICEGDDYWTDPNKLQRQTNFLEANPDYVLVTENSIYYNLENRTKKKFSTLPERDISITELLHKRQFATASVLFRNLGNDLITGGDVSGDTILWCHLSKFGKIKYLKNISSVYRRHSGGVSSGDRVQWAKKMVLWNYTLQNNHPEIDNSIFKEKNLNNFKNAVNYFITNNFYRKALFTVDELIYTTNNPNYYKQILYQYIEDLLLQKYSSWSFKIGRIITGPLLTLFKFKDYILKYFGIIFQKR